MSDRPKFEGEEELQLQLLEVSQDPTFGARAPKRPIPPLGMADRRCGEDQEGEATADKRLH